MADVFKTLQTSQVLDKMKHLEKDIPMIDSVKQRMQWFEQRMQWEARWIKLKCWLETYGE